MDLSLFYFSDDCAAESGYRLLIEGAKFADTHGFAAVWTPERHFHAFGGRYPNPAVTSAAVAAVTERVAVRAGSVVAPLHHPARIAEEWSVVDNLSGGRAGIAFASGWHANDFVLRPEAYQSRKQTLLDTVDVVRRLWRNETITLTNGTGQDVPVRIFPAPVQPELPVWLTSAGSATTFRAAGELGAGVLTHLIGQDLDVLAERIAEYRLALGDKSGHVALMLHTFLGEDDDEVRAIVRHPFRNYLRSAADLGASSTLAPDELPSEDEVEWLLDRAFERYYQDGSLLGTVTGNLDFLRRLEKIGVDEVACLIDFGVETKLVLDGLEHLDELRTRWVDST